MQQLLTKERLYFIGDIHARHSKLCNLLDFNSGDPKSIAKNSQLVFIGDLIDRVRL